MFDLHAAFVLRVLRRMGVPERDLDDAVQDAFVVAHRRLSSYDPAVLPTSWLFGIARRIAIAHRRRAHARREEPRSEIDLGSVPPGQLDALLGTEAQSILLAALESLDEPKRAVFVLYELEGVPMAEVARAVVCPLQTAYSRLHAARALVRTSVEQRFPKGVT